MHELYNYEIDGIEYLLKIKTEDIWLLEVDKIDELYDNEYITTKKGMKK